MKMNKEELIEELISDLCLLSNDGLPNLKSERSIGYIYEFFESRGMSDFGRMVIENLFEDDKEFQNPDLNKVIPYTNVNGEKAEGKVGNLLRRPTTEDAYIQAVAALGGKESDGYKKAMDDLGSEGQPDRDIEGEREKDGEGEVGGEEQPQTGTAFSPDTKGGKEYLENLPDGDPASQEFQEGILLEAAFSPSELAKTKYQPQWLDYITNGKPFQIEPYGEIIIDKSFLKSKGYGDKSLEQVLSGGTQKDIEAFFKDKNSFGTIIPSTDGKKYKLTDISKSTFTGQGGGQIPKDAAYYEMGICIEYNKTKGMNVSDAMKAASVDPKKYQKYESHLTEVCSKIARNLPNVGSALRQTGGATYTPASAWPSSDGTPKTDIYGGSSHRISVKKAGGSQLASGKKGDAVGLFMGGMAFYETHSSTNASKYLSDVISKIENEFKSFNTDNEVSTIRNTATKSYIQWRVPQIKKQTSERDDKIEKHARAEAIAVGISGGSRSWQNWFLDGVDILGERDVMKWFDEYWKSQGTKELQNEVREIVNASINHKKLDTELKKAFNDNEFKKWVVYEASSGNFKFSGNPDLNTVNDAVANKILVFDLNGKVKINDINESWASQYASNVFPSVNFKSSGRQKYTALRLIQESKDFGISDFQNDLLDIMNEEMDYVNNMITESVELFDELITEINFSQVMSKIKKIAQNLMKRILNSIKSFYDNTVKKVINKLKEYIKLGINKFLEYIGIEIDGSISLKINF